MSKIKGLEIATSINSATVFVGAIGEGPNETLQYPFGLMQDFIASAAFTYSVLKKKGFRTISTQDIELGKINLIESVDVNSINLPTLISVDGDIIIDYNVELVSLLFPLLTRLSNAPENTAIEIAGNAKLTTIDLSGLVTIPAHTTYGGGANMVVISNNQELTSVNFALLKNALGSLRLTSNTKLIVELPNLESAFGLQIQNTGTINLSFPKLAGLVEYMMFDYSQLLQTLTFTNNIILGSYFQLNGSKLITLDLSKLTFEADAILEFKYNTITSANISGAGAITGSIQGSGCGYLTTLILPVNINTNSLIFDNCALDQATVNALYIKANASGVTNGYMKIVGGTSAVATDAGLIARNNLIRTKNWVNEDNAPQAVIVKNSTTNTLQLVRTTDQAGNNPVITQLAPGAEFTHIAEVQMSGYVQWYYLAIQTKETGNSFQYILEDRAPVVVGTVLANSGILSIPYFTFVTWRQQLGLAIHLEITLVV